MHYLADIALFAAVLLALSPLAGMAFFEKDETPEAQAPSLAEGFLMKSANTLAWCALSIWVIGQFRLSLAITVFFVSCAWSLAFLAACCLVPRGRRNIITNLKTSFRFLRSLHGLDLALLLYLLAVFTLTFVLTLAPPNGQDYDSLTYHLAAPAQYLRAGRIIELPSDHHTYFPFTMEMLYLLGLELRGPVLAKLFHWLMLPLCCAALVTMGKRHLTLRAGLLGAALFASLPVVQAEASTAYIDLGLTAFVLLAFGCFFNWVQTGKLHWLLASGILCGSCLGTKYLGALAFGWLVLWMLGDMARRKNFRAKPLLGFAAIALLLGGGWYARNWMWTGNPVFPFAYEIFGGRGWTAPMAEAYTADQRAYGFGRSPSDWLWLPWRLAMSPLNAAVTNTGSVVGLPFWPLSDAPVNNGMKGLFETQGSLLQSILGPVLLAFGAPLLLARNKPALVKFCGWSFLFFWVFWAVTGQYLRYLLPAFALLCLVCGWGVEKYLNRSAILKWTTALALGAWLLFAPVLTLCNARSTLPVIFGRETPDAYLTRTFSGYTAMQWASANTPSNARFAVYGEPRCFYLQRDYFWADDPHNNLIDYAQIRSADDFVRTLKAQRATHLLWNIAYERNGGFGTPPPQIEDAIERGLLRLLFEARGYRVYAIAPAGGSAATG